jgi:hypothetical protein
MTGRTCLVRCVTVAVARRYYTCYLTSACSVPPKLLHHPFYWKSFVNWGLEIEDLIIICIKHSHMLGHSNVLQCSATGSGKKYAINFFFVFQNYIRTCVCIQVMGGGILLRRRNNPPSHHLDLTHATGWKDPIVRCVCMCRLTLCRLRSS